MKYVVLSVFLLFLSACNLNQDIAIRGVDLHTHENQNSTYVDLETIVSLGNLKLPNSVFPIKNSHDVEMGEVSLEQLDDGTSRIAVSVNYDEGKNTSALLGKTLPNNRETPIVLENETPLIGIPILENSRIYLGGNPKGNLYAGIALNVPALDHILKKVTSPLNLFMSFPFSEEVMGVAGIYSSSENGQNGLAIFAKKSQPVKNISSNDSAPVLTEIKKVDRLTLFRLSYLFNKHSTIRIK